MGAAGHPTIAVTCRADSPLAALADRVLLSPAGDEQAIVMTRSFASMLALLLRVVAELSDDPELAADLDRLPERWPEAVAAAGIGQRSARSTVRASSSSAAGRPTGSPRSGA